jgi:hypothetical protein
VAMRQSSLGFVRANFSFLYWGHGFLHSLDSSLALGYIALPLLGMSMSCFFARCEIESFRLWHQSLHWHLLGMVTQG